MLHDDPNDEKVATIQQVELNTIAASFACLSSLTSGLHQYLLDRFGAEMPSLQTYFKHPHHHGNSIIIIII
jgi:hypothetical protein